MSTTIKLKRGTNLVTGNNINIPIQAGEPIVDINSGVLYVGKQDNGNLNNSSTYFTVGADSSAYVATEIAYVTTSTPDTPLPGTALDEFYGGVRYIGNGNGFSNYTTSDSFSELISALGLSSTTSTSQIYIVSYKYPTGSANIQVAWTGYVAGINDANNSTVKMASRTGYTGADNTIHWTTWTCIADSSIVSSIMNISTIYSGTSDPDNALGQDGDLYIQFSTSP